jgi:1,4-dihydroxy-2-naphthoyl-CoA synthase
MGRAAAIDAGYEAHFTAYTSEDAQEGPLAFSQKRKPEWKGR